MKLLLSDIVRLRSIIEKTDDAVNYLARDPMDAEYCLHLTRAEWMVVNNVLNHLYGEIKLDDSD